MTRRLPRRAYHLIGRFSRTRLVRQLHPALYRRTRGVGPLGRSLGCRTIVLHTTGARSGRPRAAALYAFPLLDPIDPPTAHRPAERPAPLAVVASNGGAGHPPAWYRNLRASGAAVIEDGAERWVARARDAAGDERTRLWAVITAAYPGYDDYQATTPALIPVVILDPAGTETSPAGPD